MCSFPCVSSRPGQILRSTYPRQKNVIDQICSKAEPPELVGKVDGVLRQEGADVFSAQFGTLWRLLHAEAGIHCDSKGGPGGFVGQLRPLGGDHKGFVVGSSVNLY